MSKHICSFLVVAGLGFSQLQAWQNVSKKDYGLTIASLAYLSFNSINQYADSFAAHIYEADFIHKKIRRIELLLKDNFQIIESIAKNPELTGDEARQIGNLVEILLNLQNQCKYFIEYMQTKEPDHLKRFHQGRQRAKELLEKMIGTEL